MIPEQKNQGQQTGQVKAAGQGIGENLLAKLECPDCGFPLKDFLTEEIGDWLGVAPSSTKDAQQSLSGDQKVKGQQDTFKEKGELTGLKDKGRKEVAPEKVGMRNVNLDAGMGTGQTTGGKNPAQSDLDDDLMGDSQDKGMDR